MVGFPFQVLEYFRYKSSIFPPKFVFPPSSWAGFLFFWDRKYCLRRGKFLIVYPVTVWVSGVSQTAKTEVLQAIPILVQGNFLKKITNESALVLLVAIFVFGGGAIRIFLSAAGVNF